MGDLITIIFTSTLVTALINVLWKVIERTLKFNDAKYMQISSYYREISGEQMYDIFERWTTVLFNVGFNENDDYDEEDLLELLTKTYMCSSPETCNRLADYQTYNYNSLIGEEKDTYKSIVYVAAIIASLKYDFTGEWTSIESTLRMKITDYSKNEGDFKRVIRELGYN